MSVLTAPRLKKALPPIATPRKKRWTVDEFHALWEGGWFETSRAILLDGEIIEMPIPNPPHVMTVTLAQEELRRVFTAGFVVRVQQPLPLGSWTDPIPDVAIVKGSPRDYLSHPTSALLVVEVSDSTLVIDMVEKMMLYATAQIAEYWVVDINNRQVHVYRDPVADQNDPDQSHYQTKQSFSSSAVLHPLTAPTDSIRVADLLP